MLGRPLVLFSLVLPWGWPWRGTGLIRQHRNLPGLPPDCLAHPRSFQVPQWLEYGLATIGALAIQGGPISWVGGHRQQSRLHRRYRERPHFIKRGLFGGPEKSPNLTSGSDAG